MPEEYEQQADYQMADQYQTSFSTLPPKPWPTNQRIPNNATDEVLSEWSSRTKPRTQHPVRKVVFTLVSHDQGWGGGMTSNGPYHGSYTWFDVGKEELTAFKECKH